MGTQGTLDTFRPNIVADDATSISGSINRIVWPTSAAPPLLTFVSSPDDDDESPALPLTAILGETIRVKLEDAQSCTQCGAAADSKICRDCSGTPPFTTCLKRPATHCTYQDCPYPEYKDRSCAQEFVVYLVAADTLKVGITPRTRTKARWQEQGASHALPFARAPNRKAAGIIERAVSTIPDISHQLTHEWYEPMADAETALTNAVTDIPPVLPDRLTDCFRWPSPTNQAAIQADVQSVPALTTPALNHGQASRLGTLTPGHARESRVIGVRGPLIATNEFIINTRRNAGYTITIETEAPFIEHDDTSQATTSTTDSTPKSPTGTETTQTTTDPEYPVSDYF